MLALKVGETLADPPGFAEPKDLSIGDVAQLSGVPVATLRVWEQRHGFPAPARLGSGHRRYSARDVEAVRRVAAERAAGRSVGAAIEHAASLAGDRPRSLFSALRASRPELSPQPMSKPVLLALTRAVEDECLSRAERSIVFGVFQRERAYRQSERRWAELTRTAVLSLVFADFPDPPAARGATIEVPISRDEPLGREWAIVWHGPSQGGLLAAWERPARADRDPRTFDCVWSVIPALVRDAARICAQVAAAHGRLLPPAIHEELDAPVAPIGDAHLQLAAAITSRALTQLA